MSSHLRALPARAFPLRLCEWDRLLSGSGCGVSGTIPLCACHVSGSALQMPTDVNCETKSSHLTRCSHAPAAAWPPRGRRVAATVLPSERPLGAPHRAAARHGAAALPGAVAACAHAARRGAQPSGAALRGVRGAEALAGRRGRVAHAIQNAPSSLSE